MVKNNPNHDLPGNMIDCLPHSDGYCAICADEGIPGQVLSLKPNVMALVKTNQGDREIAVDLIEEIKVGDWVLIHAGVAIARLEQENL